MSDVVLGPSSGTYRDSPIPEWIEADGVRYLFNGTIGQVEDFELSGLERDECVIYPGLIYKREAGRA